MGTTTFPSSSRSACSATTSPACRCCPTGRACPCSASTPADCSLARTCADSATAGATGRPGSPAPPWTRTSRGCASSSSTTAAGLGLVTEVEPVPGGALRLRHTLTNLGEDGYSLAALEVVLPAPDHLVEMLDFTGRHERERSPQRREVTDGLWLRESRAGRPGLGAATMAVLGTSGFSTTHGEVLAVHVGWSGNSVLRVERDPATGTTIGGGELLLPGEVRLAHGESYSTPWVYVAAADDGLDGLAATWHAHQRSLPSHPAHQPVVLNVWEAVYFDHDLDRLTAIADRAARIGVERFVLDDGWFAGRRDDTAGLGDWQVDPAVWPEGLAPLVEHVHGARHAVRPLVRAGDGQPGLRPLPRASRLDPLLRGPDAAAPSPPARARPLPARGAGARLRAGQRGAVGVPHRRGEVGPQPRPAGGRQRRRLGGSRGPPADPRLLRPPRRAARSASGRRVGVVRLRWWARRPRGAGAGAAGVDLRHDRRPRTPADPALDHAAGRTGVRRRPRLLAEVPHHRPDLQPRLPRSDCAVRLLRHRVGPHRGLRG